MTGKDQERRELTADEKQAASRLRAIYKKNKKRLGLTQSNIALTKFKTKDGKSAKQAVISHYMTGQIPLNAWACTQMASILQADVRDFAPQSVLAQLDALKDDTSEDVLKLGYYSPRFADGGEEKNIAEEKLSYRKSDADLDGLSQTDLTAIEIADHEMTPQLRVGDKVIVRTDRQTIESGKLYALDYGSKQVVRRVFRANRNLLVIVCDNPESTTNPEVIRVSDLDKIKVMGQAWSRSGSIT